ncbi:MAG: PGPGW domain-containing protein [Candidatus Electrothrix aestuarii]|uniref:PGPGW domain-containing protein n=1 Tax=Candidatus Electrothrix aestuarii TaxID=3062594 RepID=A0AAU8LSE7_9BACT|nr:PGPGW domain-containing protein [Candidatus Electrothrix aestuarii]
MIAELTSLPLTEMLQILGLISVLTFFGSLIILPWLVLRMRSDYFIRHRQEVDARYQRHPVLAVITFLFRNSMGLFLLLAGIIMLVLPGQGILTMVIGFSLMDFPGKHRLNERIIANLKIQRSLNWIRRKGGKKELIFSSEKTI